MKAHLLRLKGFALRYWIASYSSTIFGIAIAVLIMIAMVVLEIRNLPAPAYKIFGIVQSAGPVATSGLGGGNRQVASVRRPNGNVVLADARLVRPLSKGDGVTLLVQSKHYVVLAKNLH